MLLSRESDAGTLPAHLTVEVTQRDIDLGKRINSDRCPIALAVNRLVPGYVTVVNRTDITIFGPGPKHRQWRTFKTPAVMALFIAQFDRGAKVYPITFSLNKEVAYVTE